LVHEVLQQTPSAQKPDAHSVPRVHAVPLFLVHLPLVDGLPLHESPGPQLATPQHTPSVQNRPIEHGTLAEHAVPSPSFGAHEPPLQ
jgi:hypothetical protein